MANLYCTATNYGKGFYTHQERNKFFLAGFESNMTPNVWVVGDNEYGRAWITKVNGTIITKGEAQQLVDDEIDRCKAHWETLPEEKKVTRGDKIGPQKYTLP